MTANDDGFIAGSFRDPSGFMFIDGGTIYRQVNKTYKDDYDHLMDSGLYNALIGAELIVPHRQVDIGLARTDDAYKIIEPEKIEFISYPYEWCFSQLKDAALTTLEVQKKAFEFGMTLKDSSAFNIQFNGSKPVFIDTLSFERYQQGSPWVAYKQFCQHFLAPLAIMSYRDIRLNQLFRVFIDGVPLDLASKLLPVSTWFKFSLLSHIHLHARTQLRYADKGSAAQKGHVSKMGFMGIIDSLESAVKKMSWSLPDTEWGSYYDDTNYSDKSMQIKKQIVAEYVSSVKPAVTWDLGANTGLFSRIASEAGSRTMAFDIDPVAVEKNYLRGVSQDCKLILPLLLDLTNPSGGLGWNNDERMSLLHRGPADLVMALALIHHIAISNNVPLEKIASLLHSLCEHLIIEFVPKTDSQVQRLLASREDIFSEYNQASFENVFGKYFEIVSSTAVEGLNRVLYLMKRITQ